MIKIVIPLIALLVGGWMAFDGAHALATGHYVTPASGPNAGRLGPWSHVVSAVGLDPGSAAVKWLHVILGVGWLAALLLFIVKPGVSWFALLGCAIFSLWYLPIGTVLSVVEICLLLSPVGKARK
jgi:hypothetical protein